jgi:ribonuclease HI
VSCDTSFTGASGVLWQGETMESGTVVAFWSGKFNPAQQNHPVHEQELLAIIECLKRFEHLLQGTQFQVFTDHKGLEWIRTQWKLSPRQAHWLEMISDFDFDIVHVPGAVNVLADVLSRYTRMNLRGLCTQSVSTSVSKKSTYHLTSSWLW